MEIIIHFIDENAFAKLAAILSGGGGVWWDEKYSQTSCCYHSAMLLSQSRDFLYKHGPILMQALISDYTHHNVWDEIPSPSPDGYAVELKFGNG